MSQAEALASHWVLLFFLGLLNKYMLVWSIDYPSIRASASQDFHSRIWSDWTLWSACSRSCGGGVKTRTRTCKISRINSKHRDPYLCVGETVEYELCSVHNCSQFDVEFLEQQCSQKNGLTVAGRKIDEWIPYRYSKNPCELLCWSKDRTRSHSFGKVIDGTKCAVGMDTQHPALCVNGRCMPVDCAGKIGNGNKLDRCGVCRGNNSTCIHVQEIFGGRPRIKDVNGSSSGSHYDYEKIATIPAGATEIMIKERSENNFLALVDHKSEFHVNGNWRIQAPGIFSIYGSDFLYNRTWGEEFLSTLGPTRFDVNIYILGSGDIPTVHYEYWISSNNPYTTASSTGPLNQRENEKDLNHNLVTPNYFQPENIHIHESPFTKTSPVPKVRGYNSYYHRNEILKSVPSWSIKRHRNHKNRHFSNDNILTNPSTNNYSDLIPRIVPLDTRHVTPVPFAKINANSTSNRLTTAAVIKELNISGTHKPMNIFSGHKLLLNSYNQSVDHVGNRSIITPKESNVPDSSVRDKLPVHSSHNKRLSHSSRNKAFPSSHQNIFAGKKFPIRAASNERSINSELDKTRYSYNSDPYQTGDRDNVALTNTDNLQRHLVVVPLNNRKRYDFSDKVTPNRKILFESKEKNVDRFGRPTTTLAQSRNVNIHSRSAVTQRSPYLEKDFGNDKRRSEVNSVPRRHSKRKRKSENGSCLPCPKPKHQKRIFCTSDFVLRAVVQSIEKIDNSFRYELEVSQSYKNRVPILSREYIWTMDSCRCPKLRSGKEYIIMGNSGTSGNRRESRLLLNRDSFAKKYSYKRAHNMLRVVRDQATICKNLE